MKNRNTYAAFMVLLASCLGGCASIYSTPTEAPQDGLVYYMPKQDIKITVTWKSGEATAVIDTTSPYPDLNKPYLLSFSHNLAGKNELKIGITPSGLLTSAQSTTTSGVADIAKQLGTIAGGFKTYAYTLKTPSCPDGTYTYIYPAPEETQPPKTIDDCAPTVEITRMAASKPSAANSTASTQKGAAGVFYRQKEPYEVKASLSSKSSKLNYQSIALSPSNAPVRFLPVAKTLFSKNEADFGFDNGIPTKYNQMTESELVSLLSLPADVLANYFDAIGNLFTRKKGVQDHEANLIKSDLRLEIEKIKYEACIQALRANEDELVQKLKCEQ